MELGGIAHIQRMDDARDVTQDCEQDVDEEVGAAATLQENAERRQDDGKDNLADIANKRRSQLTTLVLSLKSAGVEGFGGRRPGWRSFGNSGDARNLPPSSYAIEFKKSPYLAVKGMMIDICVERTSLFAVR